jgi:hypothetical protein
LRPPVQPAAIQSMDKQELAAAIQKANDKQTAQARR